MAAKNIIVYSCDSAFFPLLKGSILSLDGFDARKKLDLDIGFIDIGCKPEEIEWLKERGIITVAFDETGELAELSEKLVQYNRSQICRPYLPTVFSEHENILWCDADIWFQTFEGIETYISLINQYPDRVITTPFLDSSYTISYCPAENENMLSYIQYCYTWYKECYDETTARQMRGRTFFNSGLFAMKRDNPIWELWKRDLPSIYTSRVIHDKSLRHIAEQTAFNKIIFQTGRFIPLDATYNYNCHVGIIQTRKIDDRIMVCSGIPPFKPLNVVHLTMTSRKMTSYLKGGFLWDQGRYLTPEEKIELAGICHY